MSRPSRPGCGSSSGGSEWARVYRTAADGVKSVATATGYTVEWKHFDRTSSAIFGTATPGTDQADDTTLVLKAVGLYHIHSVCRWASFAGERRASIVHSPQTWTQGEPQYHADNDNAPGAGQIPNNVDLQHFDRRIIEVTVVNTTVILLAGQFSGVNQNLSAAWMYASYWPTSNAPGTVY